ncbi:MAG: diaminopimelate decarboxylase [Anaerolineae bacterium]|nr:diaminopimelate decarboxylase [Anaerolineales bacterium]MCQ3976590.1 diaminopimelate decarboxylase [Anaerolineae bacterium]
MLNKLSLFPHNTILDSEGHLILHNHRAVDLADQFGTPLYMYDVETIRANIRRYRQALATYPGPSRLTYASKAYLSVALARLMAAERVGLDVASAGELFIARQGGADPAQMHMHGNNKSRLDLSEALQAGVGRMVVDNATELHLLASLAAERQQPINIWLRVTPDITVETHHRYTVTGTADSKFGFPLQEAEVVAGELLAETRTRGREDATLFHLPASSPLRLTGLHLHLGSHFHDVEPVAEGVERLLDVAVRLRERYGWTLAELCPGGGWGVPYHPGDPPMPIEPFAKSLVAAIVEGCRRRNLPLPELVLEPGRSLVAQAGVALYTVGGRKVIPGVRTYVSIDGGLADNPRPALYQAKYTALLANRAGEAETETVAIAGPFCESGDVLIQAVDLPLAAPGDILAVPVAGAYQLSMGSNYNAALRPAVVFIEGEEVRLVQRRETFEDLVMRDRVD